LGNVFDLFAGGDLDSNSFSVVKTKDCKYCIYSNSLQNEGLYGYTSNPKFQKNSITITGRGSIGVAFYRKNPFDAIIRLLVLTPKNSEDTNSQFVTYLINQCVDFPFESTGVPQLTVPQIKNVEVYLPSLAEQTAIATILSNMDAEIEALQAKLSKAKQVKQGTMQQLLTGKIRLNIDNQTQSEQKTQKKANIHFRRSVWAAEIADRLYNEPTFGHVKMEKMIFLTENMCGIDIGSNYHRDAAGPYDNRAIRSIDSQLKKQNWFDVVRKDGGYRYIPLPKRGGHKNYFNKYFSDVLPVFDKVIDIFRSRDTERCEIVATLYSAWKDLENTNQPYTNNDIINEVINNWNETKKRIPADRWQKALDWMRKNGFAPKNCML
jgi:type I restriction enzyme S subunit